MTNRIELVFKTDSMIIALYKPSHFQILLASLASWFGVRVIEWEANAQKISDNVVPFPHSSKYTEMMEESRVDMNNFFLSKFDSDKHEASDIYFRKRFDLIYLDYYAFRKQVTKQMYGGHKIYFFGSGYNKRIYEKRSSSILNRLLFPVDMFLCYWVLGSYALKVFISCLLYGGDKHVNEVLYLRKKAYPDQGMKSKVSKQLDRLGVKCEGVYSFYALGREKYSFFFLNALSGSKTRAFNIFFQELKEIFSIAELKNVNYLYKGDIASFIKDIFQARSVVEVGSKTIVGVLVDKPIFTLLSKYKSASQLVMGINESFFYPPFRSFDYNILDVYFSLNQMDYDMQNKYGGEIKRNYSVQFFRKSLDSSSEGISSELCKLIDKYKKVVVATAMQVSETGFTQWGGDELNKFISGAVEIARCNSLDLVIIKGKKNELFHLDEETINKMDELDNMFVIYSKKPRFLKKDQYEDLLNVADIVISMSHTSTTVWQAISNNIPVIAINDAHPHSFLGEYENLEITSDKMNDAYRYWIEMEKKDFVWKLDVLKDQVNLGQGDGIAEIAKYIASTIKSSSSCGESN
jgi:hypothetical protein